VAGVSAFHKHTHISLFTWKHWVLCLGLLTPAPKARAEQGTEVTSSWAPWSLWASGELLRSKPLWSCHLGTRVFTGNSAHPGPKAIPLRGTVTFRRTKNDEPRTSQVPQPKRHCLILGWETAVLHFSPLSDIVLSPSLTGMSGRTSNLHRGRVWPQVSSLASQPPLRSQRAWCPPMKGKSGRRTCWGQT
jgi:hypothetical protein